MSRRLLFLICLFLHSISFFAQGAHRYDIVIDEIFPDPSPAVGLPSAEFIELRNISLLPIELNGWQISASDHVATIRTGFILQPDSFVIVCSPASQKDYENFGIAIGITGFPSLGNEGSLISLLDPSGMLIHAVSYHKSWYGNELKMEGGWSLEMIDPHNPCTGSLNWKASVDTRGGTPGKINSVDSPNHDSEAPELISSVCLNQHEIMVVFNEPLDSISTTNLQWYSLSGIGSPARAELQLPMLDKVKLSFESPLDSNIIYQLSVQGLTDCAGNAILQKATVRVALTHHGDPLDLVINEILFNPLPNGYDYVEIYNRSRKTIDIRRWALANRKSDGTLYNIRFMAEDARPVFPGDYLVFSENVDWISQHYQVEHTGNLIQLESLPSLPDDEGDLVLLDNTGTLIDEVAYRHQWHSPLLASEQGVALERMNYDGPSQDPENWSSAAATAGFGTPTFRNSEFSGELAKGNSLVVSPKIFSPDNDGYEDFCFLQYQFVQAGYSGNLTIFNASGNPVRYLLRSASIAREGRIRWDGLDENGSKLPMGIYIFFLEIFSITGEVRQFKSAVTLVRRTN